jgi:hypothetical protein
MAPGALTAVFPLCEKCWAPMEPSGRLPYYRSLWLHWKSSVPEHDHLRLHAEWPRIEEVVLAGG